jgi:hypothetical protein
LIADDILSVTEAVPKRRSPSRLCVSPDEMVQASKPNRIPVVLSLRPAGRRFDPPREFEHPLPTARCSRWRMLGKAAGDGALAS